MSQYKIIKQHLAAISCQLKNQSSPTEPLATESTLQQVLTALGTVNNTLSNNTNTLLTEIRDSNIAQEALVNASNNLLTDLRSSLINLEAQGLLTNQELVEVNQELDNIETTLNEIQISDSNFYTLLLNSQTNIQSLLSNLSTDNTNTLNELNNITNRLDSLITQTDQLETLLSDIIVALNNNTTVNASALEQLRLLLVNLDANTDQVEAQLSVIISEHDQTQVILTNLLTAINNNTLAVNEVETTLTGSLRTLDVVEATTDGNTDPNVQSVSVLFRGNGGTFNGVPVNNNFSFSFTPNKGEDTVGSLPYTVPTTGQQRVIISYVR